MCVICFEPLEKSSASTLPCSHSFHIHCVSNLRAQAASQVCPLCRTDLPPGPEQAFTECMKLFHSLCLNETSHSELEREILKLGTYAAEEGVAHAQFFLGHCFREGLLGPQDYKMALHWYLKAAEQGDAQAQNSVGCFYSDGHGVTQDKVKAVEWFMMAAEQGQGNVEAQHNVASMYFNGDGVKQDKELALYWYLLAAEQGYTLAQYNIAAIFHAGDGVEQDYKIAFHWLKKAAEQGHAEAQHAIELINSKLLEKERQTK
jgi:TPR repeat protein